jgi:hypothetical protein
MPPPGNAVKIGKQICNLRLSQKLGDIIERHANALRARRPDAAEASGTEPVRPLNANDRWHYQERAHQTLVMRIAARETGIPPAAT